MKYTIILCVLAISTLFSCGSSNDTLASNEATILASNEATMTRGEGEQRKRGKKDFAKLIGEMDANDDGRLSKLEVKGPLAERFDKIDTDGDGYITLEEMESADSKRRDRKPRRN